MYKQVIPAYQPDIRKLCIISYPGHRKGCPNYGKRSTCPPAAPLLQDIIDLSKPVFAVWNVFDFEAHCKKMRSKHPKWTERQVANCLYWQGTARKQLRKEIAKLFACHLLGGDTQMWEVLLCPEANGVNVTATMKSIGIELEWPPVTVAHQVALVGHRFEARREPVGLFR